MVITSFSGRDFLLRSKAASLIASTARNAPFGVESSAPGVKTSASRTANSRWGRNHCIVRITFNTSAADQFGLIVYSKLRSVEESDAISVNNIKDAAYDDNYTGIGGYGYCHYLFVTDNSPLPWTACAFIAYMSCTVDGFSAWGKDMGGYSSNPTVVAENEEKYHHSVGGTDEEGNVIFDAKNDRGFEWWKTEGQLVLEDPAYCASVAFTVGSWIEMLDKYSAD